MFGIIEKGTNQIIDIISEPTYAAAAIVYAKKMETSKRKFESVIAMSADHCDIRFSDGFIVKFTENGKNELGNAVMRKITRHEFEERQTYLNLEFATEKSTS